VPAVYNIYIQGDGENKKIKVLWKKSRVWRE